MGFPARMKRFYILVHRSSLEDLIKTLHQSSMVQITDTKKLEKDSLKDLDFSVPHYYVHRVEKAYLRVEKLLDILDTVKEEPKLGIKDMLFPKPFLPKLIKDRDKEEVLKSANKVLDSIESQVLSLSEKREDINDQLAVLRDKMAVLEKMKALNIPLRWAGDTKFTHIRIGLVKEYDKFVASAKENPIPGFSYFVFDVGGSIKEQGIVAVSILGNKKDMDQFLHKTHFTDFDLTGFTEDKTPAQYSTDLKNEEKALMDKKAEVENSLRNLSSEWRGKLELLFEELDIEHDRDDVVKNFARTRDTSMITGWIPAKEVNDLRSILSKYKASVHLEDPDPEDENIPIKIKNNWVFEPFETMTKLFGLPKYNELDPTLIMGIGFTFYFGIMLGDAGYGLMMLLGSIFLYFSLGRVSPFAKNAGYIGIWLSIATIIAGLYFGSFFGELVPRFIYGNPDDLLYNTSFLREIGAPYNALKSPMALLIFSLIAGIVTLNIGMILGAVTNIRNKNYLEFASVQLPWFFIQPSGGLLLMVGFFKMIELPTWALIICGIGMLIGTGLLVISSKYMFLFDYTAYLGDWLSFTRLMALGLGTTGIALVINVLVDLIVGSGGVLYTIVMFVVAVVLLTVLHTFNLGIQALGAGIHSMRLQFVELFGRFFSGGGEEFTPYSPNRTLTKVSNEK